MAAADGIQWTEVSPAPPPRVDSPQTMRAALAGSPLPAFLAESVSADAPVLVLVNDSHRATRTDLALRAIADTCEAAGLRPQWRLLVATGTHRFPPAERAAFERDLAACGAAWSAAPVTWHDPDDARVQAALGEAAIHQLVLGHDFLLPIGSLEPHYFAGITGAHKTVTIGVLARRDIERNHRHALDPRSDVLALEGNPVYDGHATWVRALAHGGRRICALNQVVAEGAVIAAAAGDALETLHALAPTVRDVFCHTFPEPFDVLHLQVPDPLGRMLYQADKALKNNHRAVRDGGGIVLEADCREGIGPDAFFGLLRAADSYAAAVRHVDERGYRLGDHKAVKLRDLTDPARRGVRVALVSSEISDADARAAGMTRHASVAAALAWLRATTDIRRGLRVHDAGNVCAVRAAAT